jgi:hypothetical protein
MGTVLRFPAERVRGALYPAHRAEPAAVVILPVIQIERETQDDEPGDSSFGAASPGNGSNGRRRRARRS